MRQSKRQLWRVFIKVMAMAIILATVETHKVTYMDPVGLSITAIGNLVRDGPGVVTAYYDLIYQSERVVSTNNKWYACDIRPRPRLRDSAWPLLN